MQNKVRMLLVCLNDMTEQMADMETENLNFKNLANAQRNIYISRGHNIFTNGG